MTELVAAPAPTGDSELRCAPWTLAQQVDPVGSAGRYDTVIVVEHPLPWPRDVTDVAELAGAATADPSVRVLMVVPEAGGSGARRRVTHWRRDTANRFTGTDHLVAPDDVASAVDAMAAAPTEAHGGVAGDAPPELLVCGHGKRDRCCGRWGTMLQTELAASLPALCGIDGARVRRCSHTGGHRFAPTAISFPDGRFWAHLDADLAADVMARRGDAAALHRHYRGSSAVEAWAQPLERALFEAVGWAWLDHDLVAVAVDRTDDDTAMVEIDWRGPWGEGRARAEVVVDRRIPTLVCGEPPEVATKTSPELALRSVEGLPTSPTGQDPRPGADGSE